MSCPSTEKQGWLGDAFFSSEESMYNFDLDAVYRSWLGSIEDEQGVSGDVPYVVPGSSPAGATSCTDIAWTVAYPQIASLVGTYYGDTRLAQQQWPSLTRYINNLMMHAAQNSSNSRGSDGVATCDQFLDWVTAGVCDSGMCPRFFSPTCESARCKIGEEMAGFSYVLGLRAMASMASLLARPQDATRYSDAAAAATRGFHELFWNETSRSYGSDLSGVQMLTIPALTIGAMPADQPELRDRVVQLLRADLHNRSGHHLQVRAAPIPFFVCSAVPYHVRLVGTCYYGGGFLVSTRVV